MSQELIDRLKLEAQIHAQEARAANATIAEIYQLCSGGKGEPGNWHGADPVRALVAERDALAATLRQPAARVDEGFAERVVAAFRKLDPLTAHPSDVERMRAALEAALSAQPAPERQGAVATVTSFTNGSYHRNYQLEWHQNVEAGTKLYTHPAAPVGVPDGRHREWRGSLMLAAETLEVESDHMGEGGHDAESRRMKRAATVIRSLLAAAPSAPQGTQQGVG